MKERALAEFGFEPEPRPPVYVYILLDRVVYWCCGVERQTGAAKRIGEKWKSCEIRGSHAACPLAFDATVRMLPFLRGDLHA
jgi:hypothetical protein